jgi:hypothetical protein
MEDNFDIWKPGVEFHMVYRDKFKPERFSSTPSPDEALGFDKLRFVYRRIEDFLGHGSTHVMGGDDTILDHCILIITQGQHLLKRTEGFIPIEPGAHTYGY